MTPNHALYLAEHQERHERNGWSLLVVYLDAVNEWAVWAQHPGLGVQEHFARPDRSDALAQALQWATMQEAMWKRGNVREVEAAQ